MCAVKVLAGEGKVMNKGKEKIKIGKRSGTHIEKRSRGRKGIAFPLPAGGSGFRI